jgi:glycosyltransferase involved in cell wall biosynthesis
MPRVLIVRGHQATPWELRPWRGLPERFEVSCLLTGSNRFQAPEGLRPVGVRALRDLLPGGPVGELGAAALGDRYLSAQESFAGADVVHAEELSYWFAAEAARRKRRHGFRLVQTAWETLPHMSAYRNRHARRNRELVLAETDLFLPATERAARALRLEGVGEERILVCPPGVDVDRFAADPVPTHPMPARATHTIVSPGRLVWEKGHHDVLRAFAALRRGIEPEFAPPATPPLPGHTTAPGARLLIVGSGPEEGRLRAHAAELGIADAVEIRAVPYDEMPAVFAGASAMVLASQSSATAAYHPLGVPHAFWEEQFGMVLAEAMAAGLAIVATTNGAIPEVLAGAPVDLVAPGDWVEIARALAAGPLSRPPGARVAYPGELVHRYSTAAAAERLAAAYDRVLAG